MTTPLLRMVELQEASPLAHVVANTNFRILEAHSKHQFQQIDQSAPPASPAESDVYWVYGTGTGDWAGHDGEITVWIQGAWYFLGPPFAAERWYDIATGTWYEWDGMIWASF